MSEKPLVYAPPLAAPYLSDIAELVQAPPAREAQARAAFLREVAPRLVAAVTFGNAMGKDVLDAATNLKLIALVSAGYDAFDPVALKRRGITLTNCPGLNADDVADVAIGLMISVMRGIAAGDARVRAGAFRSGGGQTRRIKGRKLGIVGLGAIGAAVGKRAEAFGLEIAWHGPRPKPEAPYPYRATLIDLAAWADILVVCVRADPGTEKMIGAEVLRALGGDGVIVNVSRGSVVDEDALIALLKSGELGGAGLDVFQQEPTPAERWQDVPNTTLTPHFGGGTRESLQDSFALAAENVRLFLAGQPVKTPVLEAYLSSTTTIGPRS